MTKDLRTLCDEAIQLWDADCDMEGAISEMRDALAQPEPQGPTGRPAIEPVPVAERPPEAGDWVWHCYARARLWEQGIFNGRQFFIGDGPYSQPATHWLPHHVLAVPQQEVQ
jgi:hypothetical protein